MRCKGDKATKFLLKRMKQIITEISNIVISITNKEVHNQKAEVSLTVMETMAQLMAFQMLICRSTRRLKQKRLKIHHIWKIINIWKLQIFNNRITIRISYSRGRSSSNLYMPEVTTKAEKVKYRIRTLFFLIKILSKFLKL